MKDSLDCKLLMDSICSTRIRPRNEISSEHRCSIIPTSIKGEKLNNHKCTFLFILSIYTVINSRTKWRTIKPFWPWRTAMEAKIWFNESDTLFF